MPMALKISYWVTFAGFYAMMVSKSWSDTYLLFTWFLDTVTYWGLICIIYFAVSKFWTTINDIGKTS